MVLLCCDFTIFTCWIDRECKTLWKKSCFISMKLLMTTKYQWSHRRIKFLKKFQKVGKNYMTLPLIITDRIIHELSPLESFRELEKDYMTLRLIITNKIIDGLCPSENSKELEQNYMTSPLTITFHRWNYR